MLLLLVPYPRALSQCVTSLCPWGKSEALSSEFVFGGERDRDRERGSAVVGVQTPASAARTQSDRTRAVVREAEDRFRQLAWETMRERFEQYADEVCEQSSIC